MESIVVVRRIRAATTIAVSIGCFACGTSTTPTQLVVRVHADPMILRAAQCVRFSVLGEPDGMPRNEDVMPQRWPLQLVVTPRGGDADRRVRVTAEAFEQLDSGECTGNALATVQARTGFIANRAILLELRLDDACRNAMCASDETCRNGACEDVVFIDPVDLPGFAPLSDSAVPDDRDGGEVIDGAVEDSSEDAPADAASDVTDTGNTETLCFDGADNDGDGTADCADTDCTGIAVCVPGIALGSPEPAGSLQCGNAAFVGGAKIRGPRACEGCSCAPPPANVCDDAAVEVRFFRQADCPSSTNMRVVVGEEICGGLTGDELGTHFQLDARQPTNLPPVGCDLSGADAVPAFQAPVGFCEAPNTGCEADELCVPATPQAEQCIVQRADACPSGYGNRTVLYESTVDQRTCDCDVVATCAIGAEAFGGGGCNENGWINGEGNEPLGMCLSGQPRALTTRITSTNVETTPQSVAIGCALPTAEHSVCCPPGVEAIECPVGPGAPMVHVGHADTNFCIDSQEVTNRDYAAFLADIQANGTPEQVPGCSGNTDLAPEGGIVRDPNFENRPVNQVDWCDAMAYCRWAGKTLCGRTDGPATLGLRDVGGPDSAWAAVCSGPDALTFPYGNSARSECPMFTIGSPLSDVSGPNCCDGATPGVYGIAMNGLEWISACDSNESDAQCAARGLVSGVQTRCDAGGTTTSRLSTESHITFRCCAY